MSRVENCELGPLPVAASVRVRRGPGVNSGSSSEAAKEVLEKLLGAIVILDDRQRISYLNASARRLLVNGLDKRLETHLRTRPDKAPLSQVRFKLDSGHDLVLKVHLTSIDWMGRKGTQVSVANVTPYLAAVTQFQHELAANRRALESLRTQRAGDAKEAAERTVASPQTQAPEIETVRNLQAQLNEQTARLAEAEKESERVKQTLNQALEENAQMRKDLATLVRVREELKESRQRMQEDLRELQARQAAGLERQSDEDRLAFEERIQALDDALAKAKAGLEIESRKALEAQKARELEQSQLLAKISELMAFREELEKKVAAHAAEAAAAREQMDAATGRCEAIERERTDLQQEVETLRRKLAVSEEGRMATGQEAISQAESLARAREEIKALSAGLEAAEQEQTRAAQRAQKEAGLRIRAREQSVRLRAQFQADRSAAEEQHALAAEMQRQAGLLSRQLDAARSESARQADAAQRRQEEWAGERSELELRARLTAKSLDDTTSKLKESEVARREAEQEKAETQAKLAEQVRAADAAHADAKRFEAQAKERAEALARADAALAAEAASHADARKEAGKLVLELTEARGELAHHAEALARADAVLAAEAASHADARKEAGKLTQELTEARGELARQAEAVRKSQVAWAEERAHLTAGAKRAIESLNDATGRLKQSDVMRQRAEEEAAVAREKLAEQAKTAQAAEAGLRRMEMELKEQADALTQSTASLKCETAKRAQAEEARGALMKELEAARATLTQHQERIAFLEREEAENRRRTDTRLQEEALTLDAARAESAELRSQLQELTAAAERADQATLRDDAERRRAEQELERLMEELQVAAEGAAAARNAATLESAEQEARREAAQAESDRARFEEQLAERNRELAEVKQHLEATTTQVLLAQASCQSQARELLDLRSSASALERKHATLERHLKARTREQAILIMELDRQIGRRRSAEADIERFRNETSPQQAAPPVETAAAEPATYDLSLSPA